MRVRDLMTTNVYFLKENATVNDAAALMKQYDIGFLPICNEIGELLGVVTDRDIVLRGLLDTSHPPTQLPVKEIMKKKISTIEPDLDIHHAALIFSEKKVHRLPVLQGRQLIGILSVSDLAKKKVFLSEVGCIVGAIISR